jgi:hypothetical protein
MGGPAEPIDSGRTTKFRSTESLCRGQPNQARFRANDTGHNQVLIGQYSQASGAAGVFGDD